MNISLSVFHKTHKENINIQIDYDNNAYDLKIKIIKKLINYNLFNNWLLQNALLYKIINNSLFYSKLPTELFNIIWDDVKKDLNMKIYFNDFEVLNDDILFWFAWSRSNHLFSFEDKFIIYLN